MADDARTGQCLCGNVRYQAILKEPHIHVCHCTLCRKWGGPGLAVQCDAPATIQGDKNLTWFKSSEWAERGFCKTCGTHLFYRVTDGQHDYFAITSGTLDSQDGLDINSHIFIDKKPDYYDFRDDAPRMTEAEFLEMLSQAG